ncbi:hypothetical protein KYB31_06480 [Clostridium felsineum]|uniref:hypothetical protein n=1 Tax=Clostridium felsineum TaxID=36839 RepID=UPI00214D2D55|nr:hypothetical protein [Clostridium felsineum]MCR3758640.1 hypothetical protein [Clostridium felsineum]
MVEALQDSELSIAGRPDSTATVDKAQFPQLQSGAGLPAGSLGKMFLKNAPKMGHYSNGDILRCVTTAGSYRLLVTKNIGPTKYDITVQ